MSGWFHKKTGVCEKLFFARVVVGVSVDPETSEEPDVSEEEETEEEEDEDEELPFRSTGVERVLRLRPETDPAKLRCSLIFLCFSRSSSRRLWRHVCPAF
jgi:hypothetical protein